MLNSHDLHDRQVIAAVRELAALHQKRYTIKHLEQPFQRGWRRYYTLSDRALDRQDRPILKAILEVIGSVVLHHSRHFQRRRGRARKLCEIEQPLRPIPVHEWQRKNYPDVWHRYFQYQLLLEWNHHWQPCWVFVQPSLYRLRIGRNWIDQIREIDPEIESRLGELDRWFELHQGWRRYGWLKGRRQSCRWHDGESKKQRFLKNEHRREIARAYRIFPEVDPAASMRRIRTSPRRIFSHHQFSDLKLRQRSIRLLTGRAGRTSLRVHHFENKHRFRSIHPFIYNHIMKNKDLVYLGVPEGEPIQHAHEFIQRYIADGNEGARLGEEIFQIVADPLAYFSDPLRAPLARSIYRPAFTPRAELAPWRQWGDDLEADAVRQTANACALPVAVAGALMPDAHPGYGLPIGGVLATENAVIPYAVGVDIACRMKLTVYDRKANIIAGQRDRLANIIESETRFGIGCTFKDRRDHEVMDDDWTVSPVTRRLRDKAWTQLGTSGSGNHFVEFGAFAVTDDGLGLPSGEYLALLSHSGSRGTGAQVCDTYSKRAMARRSDLPKELKHLAWLTLDEEDGQEYWNAMNLMGRYAAANHELIHKHIAKKVGARVILDIENHHNFAWKERHLVNGQQRELIVHRKGATPAGKGVLGIIPGSMASPGFVVRGKGQPESLDSASHGAGRVMSRSKALQSFTWSGTRKLLAERGVELLSAGLDEVPGVYKDIHSVMAAQSDLVEVLGRFDPKLVKMCPPGERTED